MPSNVMKMIKDQEVKFVDLRFTDTRGKEQHVSMPASLVDDTAAMQKVLERHVRAHLDELAEVRPDFR